MQNEQGLEPNHQAFPERLWVFRTAGPEALWSFLAWLNRYGQRIRGLAGEVHTRTVDSTVTAIGTTVFVRFQLRGLQPTGTWPNEVIRRWQRLESRVIPWIEKEACVACIQPATHRQRKAVGNDETTDLEDLGGEHTSAVEGEAARSTGTLPGALPSRDIEDLSLVTPRRPAPRKPASRQLAVRRPVPPPAAPRQPEIQRSVLGQTPPSRMPRQVGNGSPWSGALGLYDLMPSPAHLDGEDDGEARNDRPSRCRRRRRRVALRFAWRGFCGANRIRCRRRQGLRPGLGCR